MNTINRVIGAPQSQGIEKSSESQEASSSLVKSLRERAAGIQPDSSARDTGSLLASDPHLMEQAGMGQIGAIMANLQGVAKLPLAVIAKAAEKTEEISLAA